MGEDFNGEMMRKAILVLQKEGEEVMIGKTLLGPQSVSVHEGSSGWLLMDWSEL